MEFKSRRVLLCAGKGRSTSELRSFVGVVYFSLVIEFFIIFIAEDLVIIIGWWFLIGLVLSSYVTLFLFLGFSRGLPFDLGQIMDEGLLFIFIDVLRSSPIMRKL